MSNKYTRRSFIKTSATIGAASIVGGSLLPEIINAAGEKSLDIASVQGKDYFANTIKAVDMLGGISKFVSKDSKVAILPNCVCKYPATAVNPDVLLATLKMCYNAGAKDVILVKDVAENYWENKNISKEKMDIYNKAVISNSENIVLPIKNGISLKEAHINKDMMEADVFINIGIMKHHTGTNFTGILKNLMGACPHNPTNKFFHFGSNAKSEEWYDDIDFLSQCVADLNTLRATDLCIADSSEFIITNGPFGPGEIKKADTVTAGANAVSVDAFCTKFMDLTPEKVAMISMAAKHELGEMNLENLKIKEATA